MPARETVAGLNLEARRSRTSKTSDIWLLMEVRSSLISASVLLSYITVSVDSIQSVSTGPQLAGWLADAGAGRGEANLRRHAHERGGDKGCGAARLAGWPTGWPPRQLAGLLATLRWLAGWPADLLAVPAGWPASVS